MAVETGTIEKVKVSAPKPATQSGGAGSGKASAKSNWVDEPIKENEELSGIDRVLDKRTKNGPLLTMDKLFTTDANGQQSPISFSKEIFYKVTLFGDSKDDAVQFEVSPEITESRQIILNEIADIMQPGSFNIWMGSPNRTFSLEAKFVSRTQLEAEQNFRYLQLLKSWTLPPDGTPDTDVVINGPKALRLIGYGEHFKFIPVVLQSINHSYPTDVDYISCSRGPMPIIMSVSLSLKEIRDFNELQRFKIKDFREGKLVGW
jgi:hypothetical protein